MTAAEVTAMFRALGDPTRRAIFEFLCQRCCPVAVEDTGEVHPIYGATVGEVCCHITGSEKFSSTISFHLKELRLAGLIAADKDGKFMVCSVRRSAIEAMQAYLAALPTPPADRLPTGSHPWKQTMKTLQIYDPAMCCSTGVCGPSVDAKLVKLAADVAFLKSKGITVERYNLAHQPDAFVQNPLVLAEMGNSSQMLPIFIVDGEIHAKATYPNRAELASWFGLEAGVTELKMASSPCCSGDDGCC